MRRRVGGWFITKEHIHDNIDGDDEGQYILKGEGTHDNFNTTM